MESEIDNDTKDLDLFENLVEVAEHTSAAPENGCPYTLYHMDIERNQNECRAHKFEKAILSPLNSTQLVGLPRPTTVPPLQRALMIINALMYYTISGLTRESTSKVPLKISPLDQNITYITDIEVLSKFYLKSMSELFGNVFPTKVYVTSTSIKEYEHNRKVINS